MGLFVDVLEGLISAPMAVLQKISAETEVGLFVDDLEGLVSESMVEGDEDDAEIGYSEAEAESFTPVRRNLKCFRVCSLAL